MDNLGDNAWLIWVGAAVLAGLIEITSLDFFFLMLAGGALAAAGTDLLGLDAPLQVLAFALASGLLIAVVRKPLQALASGGGTVTGTAALVGSDARVLETVSEKGGLVKLSGETWTARVVPGGRTLEVGSIVHVVSIEGATAVVASAPELPEGRRQ